MSLDISGWWTREEAREYIGICERTWYRYFSWQLAGLGKIRRSPGSGHEGDRIVYPPDIVKSLADWYGNRSWKRKRLNRMRKKMETIQAWQEHMSWAQDFGYTPGSCGE